MARKFSTKLRTMILGQVPYIGGATISGTGIAAVTGTPDNFTDSNNGFVTADFAVGDTICVSGFLAAANNGIFTISSVVAGKIEIVETTVTGESAGVNVKIQSIKGGSLKDIMKDGVLKIYSGTQPTDADQAFNGTLLCTFTKSAGTFVATAPENGLRFGTAASGAIAKDSSTWQGVAVATGSAGWFRFYANGTDAGAGDPTFLLPRIDGSIGTSGAQLNMSSTTITLGATITIDTFVITLEA
jgi:hypothetical protein